jgi:RNA polymerase sigma-70 factor (ECF subfamily)
MSMMAEAPAVLLPPSGYASPAWCRQPAAMDDFLAAVEGRAFAIALSLLRDREEALDAVQDAMLRLVRSYGHKPKEDWPPLFYRILNNRIHDGFRRRRHQGRWLATPGPAAAEGQADPLAQYPDPSANAPPDHLERTRRLHALQAAVRELPRRQREAFVLRCWEGLSTAEAARAMRCTQGSVKTHYFRALHALREKLEDYRP